jgi:hypothetical protein
MFVIRELLWNLEKEGKEKRMIPSVKAKYIRVCIENC